MALDSIPVTAHVTTSTGRVIGIAEGTRLTFGRGPDADLVISMGRGLSRRAGSISAMAEGAWVANLSYTHALYVDGPSYRIRLPRIEEAGEPAVGWFVRRGTALVGSRACWTRASRCDWSSPPSRSFLPPTTRTRPPSRRRGKPPCSRSISTRTPSCSWWP